MSTLANTRRSQSATAGEVGVTQRARYTAVEEHFYHQDVDNHRQHPVAAEEEAMEEMAPDRRSPPRDEHTQLAAEEAMEARDGEDETRRLERVAPVVVEKIRTCSRRGSQAKTSDCCYWWMSCCCSGRINGRSLHTWVGVYAVFLILFYHLFVFLIQLVYQNSVPLISPSLSGHQTLPLYYYNDLADPPRPTT